MNTTITMILREGESYIETKNLDIISIEFDPLSPIVDVLEEMDEEHRMRRKITMPENNDDITRYGLLIPDIINQHILFKNMWSNPDIFMAASEELLDETVKSNCCNSTEGFLFRKHIRISKTLFIDFVMYCESSSIIFNLKSKIFDKDFGKILKEYISIKNKSFEWIDMNLLYMDMINIINNEIMNGKFSYGFNGVLYYNKAVRSIPRNICNLLKLPRKYYIIESKYKENGLPGVYIHHKGGLLRKIFR